MIELDTTLHDPSFWISILGCTYTLLGVYFVGSFDKKSRLIGFGVATIGVFIWMEFYWLVGWEMMLMSIVLNLILAILYIRGLLNNLG
jgi:hypothetical protein